MRATFYDGSAWIRESEEFPYLFRRWLTQLNIRTQNIRGRHRMLCWQRGVPPGFDGQHCIPWQFVMLQDSADGLGAVHGQDSHIIANLVLHRSRQLQLDVPLLGLSFGSQDLVAEDDCLAHVFPKPRAC